MSHLQILVSGSLSCLLTVSVVAQSAPQGLEGIFPTPIHTAGTDPEFGPYGHWVAGADYKASFGREFTFYPARGPSSANTPLRWRTETVTVGGETWRAPNESAATWHDAARWETRHASDWVERYDVRPDGIEQSFEFARRPERRGDLVLEGSITSELVAAARQPTHAALEFCDGDGQTVVRVGEAYAIDANGDRIELATGFEAGRLSIVVPASWVELAAFPILVDPAYSSGSFDTDATSLRVLDTDCTDDSEWNWRGTHYLAVFSREFASGDTDAFGVEFLASSTVLGNPTVVWQDVSTLATTRPRCSYSENGDRFAVAYTRGSSLRVARFIPGSSIGGTVTHFTTPAGVSRHRPDIIGLRDSHQSQGFSSAAFIIFFEQRSLGNPAQSEIMRVSMSTSGFTSATTIAPTIPAGTSVTRNDPAVGDTRPSDFEGFALAWRETSRRTGQESIKVQWIDYQNLPPVTVSAAGDSVGAPALDGGGDGDLTLVAWPVRGTFTSHLEFRRISFDFSGGHSLSPAQTLASGTIVDAPVLDGVAFERPAQVRWTVLHHDNQAVTATMLGHSGGVIESDQVQTGSGLRAGSIGYTPASHIQGSVFHVFFADGSPGIPVYSGGFYRPEPDITPYGTTCAPSSQISARFPWAGSGPYRITVTPSESGAPTALLLAFGPGNFPIVGSGGCLLLVDPGLLALGGGVPNGNGFAFDLELRDNPVWIGDFYVQGLWLRVFPGLPWTFGTTTGLHVKVR